MDETCSEKKKKLSKR